MGIGRIQDEHMNEKIAGLSSECWKIRGTKIDPGR